MCPTFVLVHVSDVCVCHWCRIRATNSNYYCYISFPSDLLATVVFASCLVYMVALYCWSFPKIFMLLPQPLGCITSLAALTFNIPVASTVWTIYHLLLLALWNMYPLLLYLTRNSWRYSPSNRACHCWHFHSLLVRHHAALIRNRTQICSYYRCTTCGFPLGKVKWAFPQPTLAGYVWMIHISCWRPAPIRPTWWRHSLCKN